MNRLPVLVIAAAIVLPAVSTAAPMSSGDNVRLAGTEFSAQTRQTPAHPDRKRSASGL